MKWAKKNKVNENWNETVQVQQKKGTTRQTKIAIETDVKFEKKKQVYIFNEIKVQRGNKN